MPRFKKPLYSLKRPKYRPSWNKYNLFNMDRVKDPINESMTYFQQKWHSKAMTRTYHGTTMRETDWRRIFRPDMRSVVAMNAQDLGEKDGSLLSAGRGAGRTTDTSSRITPVPYMNMVYHQLERRLDVAVWRALFASSVSQARQFVVHGGVTVNGRPMRHPGYLLNPGDMFQVEVDRVMFATGDRKDYWERRFGRQDRRRGHGKVRRGRTSATEPEDIESVDGAEELSSSPATEEANDDSAESPKSNQSKLKLQDLMTQVRAVLNNPKTSEENAARKQSLRAFAKLVRKELGQKASWNTPIKEQISTLAEKLNLGTEAQGGQATGTAAQASSATDTSTPLTQTLKADEERLLSQALKEYKENPVDYTKSWKTPWQFRPYASPFIFVPRYLEVHAPICAAVYLRHPVARARIGEVPTPYGYNHNGLTFNWYLRRR